MTICAAVKCKCAVIQVNLCSVVDFKVKILKIQIQSNCCLYWLKYRSVDAQKINKIFATRCHILSLKCTKFKIGWLRPQLDPARGAYSAPPDPLAGYKGAYF